MCEEQWAECHKCIKDFDPNYSGEALCKVCFEKKETKFSKLKKERDCLVEVLLAAEKTITCPIDSKIKWEGAWANMMNAVDTYREKYKD